MTRRIAEMTVGELARAAGVTVRLLHHYDALGLLVPVHVAANGYRLYGRAEAERLQEILLLRRAGLPLAEIAVALAQPGDRRDRLQAHRLRLAAEGQRIAAMIALIDQTLEQEGKGKAMTKGELYAPFTAERQRDHEADLRRRFGAGVDADIARAAAVVKATPGGMAARLDALAGIEADLVADFRGGLPPAKADCAAHRAWVAGMWGRECSDTDFAGLAGLYADHPDFRTRYEALAPGFTDWLVAAMRAHAGA